jgi:Kef-type K+ transport system membrane component KefB
LGFVLIFLTLSVPVRRLILRCAMDDRWAVALVWMLLMALGADWSGLHFMVGAFLAGAVIDRHWLGEDRVETFRKHVLLILMPIFFLSSGLRTEWGTGGVEVIVAALALLAAAVGGKLVGVAIAGRILGWEKGEAWTIGWLLQTKALIMIIFANVLLDKGVISASAFTALLLMAVASTVLTMPVVGRLIRRYPGLVEKAG